MDRNFSKMRIKKYMQFIKESSGYQYGCVMIEIPVSNWTEITSIISTNDIYEKVDDNTYGIQKNPHLTLLYGLHDTVTPEMVKSVLDQFKGDINIEVDGIDIFENDEFDVVKFNVKPDDTLQHLHDELSKLPNSDQYTDYKPHITIGYVKSGTGKKYIKADYKYKVKNIDKITYSMPNGEVIEIPINNYNSDTTPILEGKGVPNVIKRLGKEITDDIIKYVKENQPVKNYMILGNKIDIIITNSNIGDIRGLSRPYEIVLEFNFNSVNYESLSRVVYHELLHIYEIIKRISKNTENKLQWDVNNILRRIELKYKDEFISELCYLIYQSFDHEIGARVSDVYPSLISLGISNKNILLDYLMSSKSWEYKELLKNWKPDFNKVKYDKLIEFLDEFNSEIISKYPNLNFNVYKIPNSYKECKKIIKDWIVLFRKKSKKFEEKLLKVIDEVSNDIELINNSTFENVDNKWVIKYDKSTLRNIRIDKLL